MNKVTYKVIKHDGGWAHQANGIVSQRFQTREAARKAARLAATEQAGAVAPRFPEDNIGRWSDDSG